MALDCEQGGATYVNEPVVVDGLLVTAHGYQDNTGLLKEFIRMLRAALGQSSIFGFRHSDFGFPLMSRADVSDQLSRRARYLVLITAFLGWMFAGVEMAILIPATRPAIESFQAATASASATELAVSSGRWLSLLIGEVLLGGAVGGMLFGWLADRIGRSRAMGLSILCYSSITGLSYFVTGPEQLWVLRFLACLGIGGMWPCGVALTAEALPGVSRPFLAGWIGTSANIGFLILGLLMIKYPITPVSWRWVLLLGSLPVLLGLFVLAAVPESPQWLAQPAGQRLQHH